MYMYVCRYDNDSKKRHTRTYVCAQVDITVGTHIHTH